MKKGVVLFGIIFGVLFLTSISFVSAGFWDWWTADDVEENVLLSGCDLGGECKIIERKTETIGDYKVRVSTIGGKDGEEYVKFKVTSLSNKKWRDNTAKLAVGESFDYGVDSEDNILTVQEIYNGKGKKDYVVFNINSIGKNLVWDVDKDGDLDKQDAALISGYLFDFSDSAVIEDSAIDLSSVRPYLDKLKSSCALDIDGNGDSGALTDGILIGRYIIGMRSFDGAFGSGATRTTVNELWEFMDNANAGIDYCLEEETSVTKEINEGTFKEVNGLWVYVVEAGQSDLRIGADLLIGAKVDLDVNNPFEIVNVNGVEYRVELVAASDTAATIKVAK